MICGGCRKTGNPAAMAQPCDLLCKLAVCDSFQYQEVAMKTRRFLFVITLIGITLACKLIPPQIVGESAYTSPWVDNVAVNPQSGNGSFTLVVTYTANTDGAAFPEPITCYYVTPDGATLPIGSVSPPPEFRSSGGATLTGTLSLSVSDPGFYTATCENNSSTSKASAVFGVTDPPGQSQTEPTPTAPLQPTQQPEQIAFTMYGNFSLTWPTRAGMSSGEYTSGEIQINIDQKTGLATGSLRGSGSGTMEYRDAGHSQTVQWNYSYTVSNFTGSIDALTGMLTLNGIADAQYNWVSTNCKGDDGDNCLSVSPNGQWPVKITGTVNLANHTGSGIVDATQNPDYPSLGEWQSIP